MAKGKGKQGSGTQGNPPQENQSPEEERTPEDEAQAAEGEQQIEPEGESPTAVEAAPQSPLRTIRDMMVGKQKQIEAALPSIVKPQHFLRVIMSTIKGDSKLQDCTPDSILRAVLASAQTGLEPDPILGHAYLVPFFNRKAYQGRGALEAQFMIGYKGLIELARRSGQVISISAQVVYTNDKFDFEYALGEDTFTHRPALGEEERGKPKAVWAKAVLKDGGRVFEVMSVADVNKIRDLSKAGNSGPWRDHWDEMARKTAVRKLAKYLPLSSEFQRAAALDEAIELGHASEALFALEDDPEGDPASLPSGDQVATASSAQGGTQATRGKLDKLKNRKPAQASPGASDDDAGDDKGEPS